MAAARKQRMTTAVALRVLLVLALMCGVTTLLNPSAASATTLDYNTAPTTCPDQNHNPYSGGPDSWCLSWFNMYSNDAESIGVFTVHVNDHTDTTVDVPVPHGGLAFSEGGLGKEVFGGFLRDPATNAAVDNGRRMQIEPKACAVAAKTCEWVFHHEDFPAPPPGAHKPDPVWTFWSYAWLSDNGCCWVGDAGFAFKIIDDNTETDGNPTAGFTYTDRSGQVDFLSTSTDPGGEALFSTWNFGDGTPAGSGDNPSHKYKKPGTYHVTLSVRNIDGHSDSITKDVVVKPPTLGVDIEVVDGPTSIAPDDKMKVDVTVSASSDGLGKLNNLAFDSTTPDGLLAQPDTRMSLESGGPDDLPSSLAPGDSKTLHYTLTGGPETGNVTLSSIVNGKDDSGAAVSAIGSRHVNVAKHALAVTVTPEKNDIKLDKDPDGKPKPETIKVTIGIENTSDDDVTDVTVAPMDLAASDPTHPYEPFPAKVVGGNDDIDVGTIAAGDTHKVQRSLKLTGDGIIDLKELVNSSDGVETAKEQLRIGVTTLLEMKIAGDGDRNVVAGHPVTIFGTFKNVTNDRTVAITDPIKALRTGNVLGGGIVARADGDWLNSDYPPPLITTLKPGQSVDFQVRLGTARPTVEDYDEGTDDADEWTQGTVSFLSPRAAVEEDDGTWSALTADPVQINGKYPSSIRIDGAGFGTVSLNIDTSQLPTGTTLDRIVQAGFGLTEGALEGALNRLTDVLGSTVLFTIDPQFRDETIEKITQNQSVVDALDYLAAFAVYLPQADQKELVDTAASRLADAYGAFTDTVTGGIPHPHLPGEDEIKTEIDTYLKHLAGAWGRGDPNELVDAVRPIGQVVGEQATDVLVAEASFEALAELAKAPKYANAAIASWKDERTIAQMKAKFPSAAQQTLELKAQELSKSKYPLLEQAYDGQRPLQDVDLGVGAHNDGAGLSRQTIDSSRKWTKENPNKTIVVIPNEANVAAVRDAEQAVGKIENIKPKSMARIEYDVLGGRPSDINNVILRGDLTNLTKADVNRLIDKAIAAGQATEEDRAVVQQIVKKRNKEWASFVNRGAVKDVNGKWVPDIDPATGKIKPDDLGIGNLKGYDEAGRIPNQFRGVDNGLPVTGPQQYPKFEIEYFDENYHRLPSDRVDEAAYAVPTQESPTTGKLVKITGDDDGIFIGLLNGLGLPASELNNAYLSLMDVFNHPFSDTWLAQINKKLEIFSRYFATIPGTDTAGAPLVMFVNGEAYAVKIDAWLTRFDTTANRAYVAFVGAPRAIDPIAAQPSFIKVFLDKVKQLFLPASFLQMFLHDPNAASQGAPTNTVKTAKIVRINPDGHLEAWTPSSGWQLDLSDEALAADGKLAVAPETTVLGPTKRGGVEIPIASQSEMGMVGDWFEVGDDVVIDPGGPDQETATVSAFGSLIFAHGMSKPHQPGELIADLGPRSSSTSPPAHSGQHPPTLAATGVRAAQLGGWALWLMLCGAAVLSFERSLRRRPNRPARR